MRQNEIFGQENTCQGAYGIEGLGEVQTADARFLGPHGENEGVAGGLQNGEASGQHEDSHQIDIETLPDGGGNVAQRADHVEPQPDEDTRLIGKFLQKDGGENGKHRIGPIEGNLNSGGFRSIDHEYFAKCRNQVVRHVVQEAPQRKTGDQHEERQPVLFGNDRHGRGTVVIHIAFVNFSQGRRCVNLETEKSPEIIQPVDKKNKMMFFHGDIPSVSAEALSSS